MLRNEEVMRLALKKKADAAEVFLLRDDQTTILQSQGKVEVRKSVSERGIGLRLWKKDRVGFGYSNELTRSAVVNLLDTILATISLLPPRTDIRPAPAITEDFNWMGDVEIIDPETRDMPLKTIIKKIKAQEQAAFDYSSLIKICRETHYSKHLSTVHLTNSEGFDQAFQKTCWETEIALISESNTDRKMKFHGAAGIFARDWKPQVVGEQAAQKAIISLGGKKVRLQECPVVINNSAMIPILAMLAAGFYGERIDRKMSVFADKEGKQIAAQRVTLIDDGRMDGGFLTCPFDGEGIPTQRTTLIDRGFAHGFLHNLASARKRGISSTGNAIRHSFKNVPEVSHTNLYLSPSKTQPEDLVRNLSDGFYLFDTIDPRAIDLVSGKLTIIGDGLWISNGAFTEAITAACLSCDVFDFLKGIQAVANDLLFMQLHPFLGGGYVGSPTVRVQNMTITSQ